MAKITYGRDYNFFKKQQVTSSTFQDTADLVITFPTQSLMLLNENASGVVEYSFNGNTVHGELDPTLPSKGVAFDNRVVSQMWFRVKSGSSGPITVRVDAWGTR